MRKLTVVQLFLLLFCASCAQAQKQEASSPSSAASAKATVTLNHNELYVGRVPAQPVPDGFAKEIRGALACFSADLKNSAGFRVHIVNDRLRVEEGSLLDQAASETCLLEKKLMKLLNSYWLWTPNLETPSEVRKNYTAIKLDPIRIFKGPKAQ